MITGVKNTNNFPFGNKWSVIPLGGILSAMTRPKKKNRLSSCGFTEKL